MQNLLYSLTSTQRGVYHLILNLIDLKNRLLLLLITFLVGAYLRRLIETKLVNNCLDISLLIGMSDAGK